MSARNRNEPLVKGLGIENGLEITFHRSHRVEDHPLHNLQAVTRLMTHWNSPFELYRLDSDDERLYLLAAESAYQYLPQPTRNYNNRI